jgi:hypothetical protein
VCQNFWKFRTEFLVFENFAPFIAISWNKKEFRFKADLEIFESTQAEGHSLRDTPKLVWRVYLVADGTRRQVFINLKFLECVSFT